MSFVDFYDDFKLLAVGRGWTDPSMCTKARAREYCTIMLKDTVLDDNFQIGTNFVFLRTNGLKMLKEKLVLILNRIASKIQGMVLTFLCKRRFLKKKEAAIVIQKTFRKYNAMKRFEHFVKCIKIVQKYLRGETSNWVLDCKRCSILQRHCVNHNSHRMDVASAAGGALSSAYASIENRRSNKTSEPVAPLCDMALVPRAQVPCHQRHDTHFICLSTRGGSKDVLERGQTNTFHPNYVSNVDGKKNVGKEASRIQINWACGIRLCLPSARQAPQGTPDVIETSAPGNVEKLSSAEAVESSRSHGLQDSVLDSCDDRKVHRHQKTMCRLDDTGMDSDAPVPCRVQPNHLSH